MQPKTAEVDDGTRRSPDHKRPGILVDTADIPGGGQLQLVCHRQDYEILFENEQLMGSWAYRSEEALATLVFARLGGDIDRVLIGGLGMGFTLGTALRALSPQAKIVVAELVPKIVDWAKGPLAHLFGNSLSDPRVALEIRDVHDVIAEDRDGFDAILLDVDNGPEGLISLANERLYCNWGLRSAHAALRPGGIFAIWSAFPDRVFSRRLRDAAFDVKEVSIVSGDKPDDPAHHIWLAAKATDDCLLSCLGDRPTAAVH